MNLKVLIAAAIALVAIISVVPARQGPPGREGIQPRTLPCLQEGAFNFKNIPPSSDGIRSLNLFRGTNISSGLLTISNESTSASASVDVGFIKGGLSFGGSSQWTTLYPGNSTSLALSSEGVVLRSRSPEVAGRYVITVLLGP
jgi:hypothetical protein